MLTDTKLRTGLKTKDKQYKVADSGGLYILVHTNGSKYFRMKYRYLGSEKVYSIGKYPQVTLKEARQARDEAKRLLAQGIDPTQHKKASKLEKKLAAKNTFEAVAREWHQKRIKKWKPKHAKDILRNLENNVFPFIGSRPVKEINSQDILHLLRRVEKRGSISVIKKVKQWCNAIFTYGVVSYGVEQNPVTTITMEAFDTPTKGHFPWAKVDEIPELVNSLNNYQGSVIVKNALKLKLMLFPRAGELLGTRWDELDFENKELLIPASRMKGKNPQEHLIPLPTQAIILFKQLQQINGRYEHVFASPNKPRKPISGNALIRAMWGMGWKDRCSPHGMRRTASTALNEAGFNPDYIERSLAHLSQSMRAVYNKSQYLEGRRMMHQLWANWLDDTSKKLSPDNNLTPLKGLKTKNSD